MLYDLGTAIARIGISDVRKGFSDFRNDRRPADGKVAVVLGGKLQGYDLDGTDPDLMRVIKEPCIFYKLIALDLDDPALIQLGTFFLQKAPVFNLPRRERCSSQIRYACTGNLNPFSSSWRNHRMCRKPHLL